MEILAIVLSTLGTVGICTASFLKGNRMKLILLLVCVTNLLIATSYLITDAYSGAMICFIGAILTIINYFFDRKDKPIPIWLICIYAVVFVGANLVVFSRPADVLCLLASLVFILSISQKNGKGYRIWILVNTGLWVAYDLITASYGPLSTHLIQIATNILAMIIHDRKANITEKQV